MVQSQILDQILQYAKFGYHVFPIHGFVDGLCTCGKQAACKDIAKHPLTDTGYKAATTDLDQIRNWYQNYKDFCNWGFATGQDYSKVWVLDVDKKDDGPGTLANLLRQHGALPRTAMAKTGGGGEHYYFALPEGLLIPSRARFLPGLDTRGEGGYVLAPPSLHQSGNRYEWIVPFETTLAEAPTWLLDLILAKNKPKESSGISLVVQAPPSDLENSPGVGEGGRNDTLCRLIGVHVARQESLERIQALAIAWAKRCIPPFDEEKTVQTVNRLWSKEHGFTDNITSTSECVEQERKNCQQDVASATFVDQPVANSFFLSFNSDNEDREDNDSECAPSFPSLPPDALQGLSGDIASAIAPETEADIGGVLLSLLVGFGSCLGKGAWCSVGSENHFPNLFACLVGDTASGKGQAWGVANGILAVASTTWKDNLCYGLSSGEGLVERVQDQEQGLQDSQFILKAPELKTLMCYESEFARPLTAMRRDGNTLSPIIRSAWDSQPLEVLTRKQNKLRASNAHISILAHITPEELTKVFSSGLEVANGFANRFLWVLVKRSQLLPHGGNTKVLDRFVQPLREAIAKGKTLGFCQRSPEANQLWEAVYPELSSAKTGHFGKATERARPQVVRLSLLYAALDGSRIIQEWHLKAALALWRYCQESAKVIFGDGDLQTTHPQKNEVSLDKQVLNAIRSSGSKGISKSDLLRQFQPIKSGDLDAVLSLLQSQGKAFPSKDEHEGSGRKAELWFGKELKERKKEFPQDPITATFVGQPDANSEPNGQVSLPKGQLSDFETNSFFLSRTPQAELSMIELSDQVRNLPGIFRWDGDCVSVDSKAIIPDAIVQAIGKHQADLQTLVPKPKAMEETPKEKYPTPESVVDAIILDANGRIFRDAEGNCAMELPSPNPELEDAFRRFSKEHCPEFMASADFVAELRG